jgi:hypothetical protein
VKIRRKFPDDEFIQTSIQATLELRKELKRLNGNGYIARERQFYTDMINGWIDIADSCFRKAAIRNSGENYRALKRLEKDIENAQNVDSYNFPAYFLLTIEKLETVIIDTYSLMEVPMTERAKEQIRKHEAKIVDLKLKIATHRSMIKDIQRRA